MSNRADIASALSSIVPKKWSVLDTDRDLGDISRIVLLVSQRKIEPAPNAQGNHRVTSYVYVVEPGIGVTGSEDALDDATDTVLFAIDKGMKWAVWTTAEKVLYQGHRAYQITLEAASEPKE